MLHTLVTSRKVQSICYLTDHKNLQTYSTRTSLLHNSAKLQTKFNDSCFKNATTVWLRIGK